MTPELLAQIAELLGISADDVTALTLEEVEERLIAAFTEATQAEDGTPADLTTLTAMRDARQGVRAAIEAADAEAERQAAEIAALAADMAPVTGETEPPAEETPATPPAEGEGGEAAPEGEQPAGDTVPPTEAVAPVEETPVAVAAAAPVVPMRRRPRSHAPVPTTSDRAVTITAAADVPGFSAGAEIPSLRDVGQAFADRMAGLENAKGIGGRVPVARFHLNYPEERQLLASMTDREIESRIRAVNSPAAIQAAGGLCAPVAIRYELENDSVDDRPVRDSLPRFNADRGGINVPVSPLLTAPDAGVGVITAAQDVSDTTKPCVVITCPSFAEVDIHAVYQCLTIGNFSKRTFPELFAQWWALASALHARKAEGALLAGIGDHALTKSVTDGQNLGAARDVLEVIIRLVAIQASTYRLGQNQMWRLYAPLWLRSMMKADLVREMPGAPVDRLREALNEIDAMLAAAGVNVTWYLDEESGEGQIYAAQGNGAAKGWNLSPVTYLFPEGDFLFLDGGELDLGTEIRDSTLNLHNQVNAFTESFENIAYVGQVPPLKITHSLCVNGAAGALASVTCANAS